MTPYMTSRSDRANLAITLATVVLAAGSYFGTAQAGDAAEVAAMTPQQQYDKDRAACLSGRAQQEQAACLREAGAALEESKRNQLGAGEKASRSNALARCANLPPQDRNDCRARVQGDDATSVSGSVGGGGVLRERTTRTQVPAPTQ